MKRNLPGLMVASICIVAACCCHLAAADDDQSQVIKAFAQHVEALDSLTAEQKSEVAAIIAETASDSPADAITESLTAIHADYGAAIEASDGDDLPQILELLTPFANSDDKFLAADASYYLARSLMNLEQFEQAVGHLDRVLGVLSDYHVHQGNARFYMGAAQAGLLKYGEAIATLTDFLKLHPVAPERLRVAAWRQVQQLQSITEGQMEDIYQRMDFSRRRLSLIEPGEETQQQQDRIVNMLAKLIKEQEKKEASGQSKDQQDKQQQQQQQQQQQASKQQQQGKSQTGGQSSNPNGQTVRKTYDDGPASPWSRLRDRSRDPANNAIKDRLPARYRDIVERYYEAANGDSKK